MNQCKCRLASPPDTIGRNKHAQGKQTPSSTGVCRCNYFHYPDVRGHFPFGKSLVGKLCSFLEMPQIINLMDSKGGF